MAFIFVGSAGFVVGYLADLLSIRRIPVLRAGCWLLAFALISYSLFAVSVNSSKFWLPGWITIAGWVVLPISSLLLAYSLFVELPLIKTYAGTKGPPEIVTSGTYALVRHPTALWDFLILASLILASRSNLLLVATPIWVTLDLLWVLLQEKSLLSLSHNSYYSYQKNTPFLLPTLNSIKSFLGSPLAFRSPVAYQEDVHVSRD